MKIEEIKYEGGRRYLQTWITALNVMLGWPEEQTLKWAAKWEDSLNDENSLLFHWTEGEYILILIIPESLKAQLSSGEKNRLWKVLLRVIEKGGSFCYQKPDFDWHEVKQRVDRFLAEVERFKKISDKSIEHFLQDYEKRFLIKKISNAERKHLRDLLKKTYVS